MVKPLNLSGKRGRTKSLRRMRGRFGSSGTASPPTATMPAATATPRNCRLVVGIRDTYSEDIRTHLQNNRMRDFAETFPIILPRNQKLKVSCRSIRRLAEEFEKGPDCSWFGMSKNREPKIPLGLAKLTLLKTLRAVTPKVRL